MTAAAAVAAVAAAAVVLAQQSGPGSPPGPLAGAAAILPPRYAALANQGGAASNRSTLVIRDTATGQTLDTVAPPRPANSFCDLSGTPDGRTFVVQACTVTVSHPSPDLGTVGTMPGKFYKLTVGVRGKATSLTPLPIPLPGPDDDDSLAVSPDGSKIAIASVNLTSGGLNPAIRLYSLGTGQLLRSWTWAGKAGITVRDPGASWAGVAPVSWTADGRTIAFPLSLGDNRPGQVRLLDTTAPGSDLRRTRLVLNISQTVMRSGWLLTGPDSIITPDGSRIVAAVAEVSGHPARTRLTLAEFSAATGARAAELNPVTFRGDDAVLRPLLWSSPDGSTLITTGVPAGGPGSREVRPIGVVTGGRFTPLPGRMAGITQIAF